MPDDYSLKNKKRKGPISMDNRNYNNYNEGPERPRTRKKVSKETLRKRQLTAVFVIAFIVLLFVILIAKACSKGSSKGGDTKPAETVTTTTTAVTTSVPETTAPATLSTTTTIVTGSNDPEKGFKLDKYSVYINVGESGIAYVQQYPEGSSEEDEVWTSSDEKIATVDAYGHITGVSGGECYVTLKAKNNPTQEVMIRVVVAGTPAANNDQNNNGNNTPLNNTPDTEKKQETEKKPETAEAKQEVKEEKPAEQAPEAAKAETEKNPETPEPQPLAEAPAPSKINDPQAHYEGNVLIVNKSYPISENYNPGTLDPNCNEWFNKLTQDAAKEGLNIYFSSGFRSYNYQKQLYDSYVNGYGQASADTFSARPGYSEHQTGLAIDVNSVDDSFRGTPEAIWLADNCYKYGFIIRYPEGKEGITGYKYEPWHIRYVGSEIAKKVHDAGSNATLEEIYGLSSQYS